LGGISDLDSSVWIVSELERNLKICIDEKTAKVAAIREKYSQWWLILIDHIGYGRERSIHIPPNDWNKIILVDPEQPEQAVELANCD
jgi:hypothetical protein